MVQYPDDPVYSERYYDDHYEYRHVILTRAMTAEAKQLMATRSNGLLSEHEWRSLGVQQSRGWQHYMQHPPEAHVLLFRRARGTDPQTGLPSPSWRPPVRA